MKRLIGVALMLAFALSAIGIGDAEAKKRGGGPTGPKPPKCTPASTPGCS